jgi:hypothetical protein
MEMAKMDLVRVTVNEPGQEAWPEAVFEVRPRPSRKPSRLMRAALLVVLVGLVAVTVRHVRSGGNVRSRDPLQGSRAKIAAAQKEFASRQTIIEAIGSQMERRQQELADVEWANSEGRLPIDADVAAASSQMRAKMAAAKKTRSNELLRALEIRKDALTDQNVALLARIRRAEVELIRAEQALDGKLSVDGVDERIEALLAGKDGP